MSRDYQIYQIIKFIDLNFHFDNNVDEYIYTCISSKYFVKEERKEWGSPDWGCNREGEREE